MDEFPRIEEVLPEHPNSFFDQPNDSPEEPPYRFIANWSLWNKSSGQRAAMVPKVYFEPDFFAQVVLTGWLQPADKKTTSKAQPVKVEHLMYCSFDLARTNRGYWLLTDESASDGAMYLLLQPCPEQAVLVPSIRGELAILGNLMDFVFSNYDDSDDDPSKLSVEEAYQQLREKHPQKQDVFDKILLAQHKQAVKLHLQASYSSCKFFKSLLKLRKPTAAQIASQNQNERLRIAEERSKQYSWGQPWPGTEQSVWATRIPQPEETIRAETQDLAEADEVSPKKKRKRKVKSSDTAGDITLSRIPQPEKTTRAETQDLVEADEVSPKKKRKRKVKTIDTTGDITKKKKPRPAPVDSVIVLDDNDPTEVVTKKKKKKRLRQEESEIDTITTQKASVPSVSHKKKSTSLGKTKQKTSPSKGNTVPANSKADKRDKVSEKSTRVPKKTRINSPSSSPIKKKAIKATESLFDTSEEESEGEREMKKRREPKATKKEQPKIPPKSDLFDSSDDEVPYVPAKKRPVVKDPPKNKPFSLKSFSEKHTQHNSGEAAESRKKVPPPQPKHPPAVRPVANRTVGSTNTKEQEKQRLEQEKKKEEADAVRRKHITEILKKRGIDPEGAGKKKEQSSSEKPSTNSMSATCTMQIPRKSKPEFSKSQGMTEKQDGGWGKPLPESMRPIFEARPSLRARSPIEDLYGGQLAWRQYGISRTQSEQNPSGKRVGPLPGQSQPEPRHQNAAGHNRYEPSSASARQEPTSKIPPNALPPETERWSTRMTERRTEEDRWRSHMYRQSVSREAPPMGSRQRGEASGRGPPITARPQWEDTKRGTPMAMEQGNERSMPVARMYRAGNTVNGGIPHSNNVDSLGMVNTQSALSRYDGNRSTVGGLRDPSGSLGRGRGSTMPAWMTRGGGMTKAEAVSREGNSSTRSIGEGATRAQPPWVSRRESHSALDGRRPLNLSNPAVSRYDEERPDIAVRTRYAEYMHAPPLGRGRGRTTPAWMTRETASKRPSGIQEDPLHVEDHVLAGTRNLASGSYVHHSSQTTSPLPSFSSLATSPRQPVRKFHGTRQVVDKQSAGRKRESKSGVWGGNTLL